ncbi:hypothetical protein QZH41_015445 [Actinostola sp. cb2023]|nr:hypothetical protein QZH41_015445 [Actinostola sp. cb2023]
MKIYGLTTLVLLFAAGSWCCSLPPNVPYYSIVDRAVLAPLVIHGRVLNISTTTRQNVFYKACVRVIEVMKGESDFPRELCFGDFGGDYLCLNDVYEDNEYIFYMNSDRTARYKDGIPISVVLANNQTLNFARQGYCNPHLSQPTQCERPTINRKIFHSVIRAQEGRTVAMSCYASGTAPLLVTWSKRDSTLSSFSSPTTNRYFIYSVGVSDTGVYICTIRNPAGVTTALVRLYVDPVPCGAFLFLRPGEQSEIQSPNYPQPYSKDKMCSWRICPAHGQRVKLDFTHFDLRRNLDDNLQIYHVIRFTPRVAYFSTMTGRVLHNYKNTGPKPGQDIQIKIDSSIRDLFGCYTEIKENREYYVGASVSSRSYTLRFVLLTDAQNKPDMFDQQLNKFKTLQRDCSPRPPASRPPTPEWPTDPPTPEWPTVPPRTPERPTVPPRTPERATELPRIPQPSSIGTPNPLDP